MEKEISLNESNKILKDKAKTISIIVTLSALCVATSYAMLPFLNVKLIDCIVFITGYCFGFFPSIFVSNISWLIYGTLNPLGFSIVILIACMLAETIYAITGWSLNRYMNRRHHSSLFEHSILFGITGLTATLAYDISTNAVYGWFFYNSIWLGLLTMNFPVPMGLMHEISNLLLFATITPLLIRVIKKLTIR